MKHGFRLLHMTRLTKGLIRARLEWFVVSILMAQDVLAQPPLDVHWMSEFSGLPPILDAFVNPNNVETEVVYDESGTQPCYNEEYAERYDSNGNLAGSMMTGWGECLNANVTHDRFAIGTSRIGFPNLRILNACDLNVVNCWMWCNGSIITGPTIGSPSYSHASAKSVLADGGNIYIGANSSHCPSTGWTLFKPGGGSQWPICVPAVPTSLEATSDSILSISFPGVHMVAKTNAAFGSTFNLFSGSVSGTGKTCIDGDTLYWTCKVNGSLHAGKYLLGQGSLWEQTLPFSAPPVELVRDAHGRLWTATGNNLVWLDTASGTFASETIGVAITALDLQMGRLVIAGSMPGNLRFIMNATPMP